MGDLEEGECLRHPLVCSLLQQRVHVQRATKEGISLYSDSPPLNTGKWDRVLATKQALN